MIEMAVMYRNRRDANCDLNAFITKLIPLIRECWDDMGLKGIRVLNGLAGGVVKSEPGFQAMIFLQFEAREELRQAVLAHGERLLLASTHHIDQTPVIQVSELVALSWPGQMVAIRPNERRAS